MGQIKQYLIRFWNWSKTSWGAGGRARWKVAGIWFLILLVSAQPLKSLSGNLSLNTCEDYESWFKNTVVPGKEKLLADGAGKSSAEFLDMSRKNNSYYSSFYYHEKDSRFLQFLSDNLDRSFYSSATERQYIDSGEFLNTCLLIHK